MDFLWALFLPSAAILSFPSSLLLLHVTLYGWWFPLGHSNPFGLLYLRSGFLIIVSISFCAHLTFARQPFIPISLTNCTLRMMAKSAILTFTFRALIILAIDQLTPLKKYFSNSSVYFPILYIAFLKSYEVDSRIFIHTRVVESTSASVSLGSSAISAKFSIAIRNIESVISRCWAQTKKKKNRESNKIGISILSSVFELLNDWSIRKH